ncbi:cyclase family protein [Nafulsella turpanensis]|uniref:cyclase family protein n=1 Tax=Nafulsella turpanensis TaxID=1265690 RepID=UPI000348B572|nr:cyclase family protein [Nafulsella turpanensis]
MSSIIDITAPFSNTTPVWPGVEGVKISTGSSIALGHMGNTLRIDTINHAGTHMDAPRHFLNDGKTLDALPLEVVCGRAKVIWVDSQYEITIEDLQKACIAGEERVLIKSRMSAIEWWTQPFIEDFVHLSDAAAEYLVEVGVKLVGVDYVSVAGYNKNEVFVHQTLLGNDIWIIEGLVLAEAEPGYYELCCLPLKLKEGDGAPCRAILKPIH